MDDCSGWAEVRLNCGVLVHLAGFGFEVFVEGDFEVEEFFAVGVFDFVEVEECAL